MMLLNSYRRAIDKPMLVASILLAAFFLLLPLEARPQGGSTTAEGPVAPAQDNVTRVRKKLKKYRGHINGPPEKRMTRDNRELLEKAADFIADGGWRGQLEAPAGVGKTVGFSHLIEGGIGGTEMKAIVVVNRPLRLEPTRDEIVRFTSFKKNQIGLYWEKQKDLTQQILIITRDSFKTLVIDDGINVDEFPLIIVDENDDGWYTDLGKKVIDKCKKSIVFGYSATTEENNVFPTTVWRMPIKDAIQDRGLLANLNVIQYVFKLVDIAASDRGTHFHKETLGRQLITHEEVTRMAFDAVDVLTDHFRIPFLLNCTTIDHAKEVAKKFTEWRAPVGSVYSGDKDRDNVILDFENEKSAGISNVGVMGRSYSFDKLAVIINLNPTLSPRIATQRNRGSRFDEQNENKENIVVDFVYENTLRDKTGAPKQILYPKIAQGAHFYRPGTKPEFISKVSEKLKAQVKESIERANRYFERPISVKGYSDAEEVLAITRRTSDKRTVLGAGETMKQIDVWNTAAKAGRDALIKLIGLERYNKLTQEILREERSVGNSNPKITNASYMIIGDNSFFRARLNYGEEKGWLPLSELVNSTAFKIIAPTHALRWQKKSGIEYNPSKEMKYLVKRYNREVEAGRLEFLVGSKYYQNLVDAGLHETKIESPDLYRKIWVHFGKDHGWPRFDDLQFGEQEKFGWNETDRRPAKPMTEAQKDFLTRSPVLHSEEETQTPALERDVVMPGSKTAMHVRIGKNFVDVPVELLNTPIIELLENEHASKHLIDAIKSICTDEIKYVSDFIQLSRQQIRSTPGVWQKGSDELEDILWSKKLTFGTRFIFKQTAAQYMKNGRPLRNDAVTRMYDALVMDDYKRMIGLQTSNGIFEIPLMMLFDEIDIVDGFFGTAISNIYMDGLHDHGIVYLFDVLTKIGRQNAEKLTLQRRIVEFFAQIGVPFDSELSHVSLSIARAVAGKSPELAQALERSLNAKSAFVKIRVKNNFFEVPIKLLNMPIDDFLKKEDGSNRVSKTIKFYANALHLKTMGDLLQRPTAKIRDLRNLGQKSFFPLLNILSENKVSFGLYFNQAILDLLDNPEVPQDEDGTHELIRKLTTQQYETMVQIVGDSGKKFVPLTLLMERIENNNEIGFSHKEIQAMKESSIVYIYDLMLKSKMAAVQALTHFGHLRSFMHNIGLTGELVYLDPSALSEIKKLETRRADVGNLFDQMDEVHSLLADAIQWGDLKKVAELVNAAKLPAQKFEMIMQAHQRGANTQYASKRALERIGFTLSELDQQKITMIIRSLEHKTYSLLDAMLKDLMIQMGTGRAQHLIDVVMQAILEADARGFNIDHVAAPFVAELEKRKNTSVTVLDPIDVDRSALDKMVTVLVNGKFKKVSVSLLLSSTMMLEPLNTGRSKKPPIPHRLLIDLIQMKFHEAQQSNRIGVTRAYAIREELLKIGLDFGVVVDKQALPMLKENADKIFFEEEYAAEDIQHKKLVRDVILLDPDIDPRMFIRISEWQPKGMKYYNTMEVLRDPSLELNGEEITYVGELLQMTRGKVITSRIERKLGFDIDELFEREHLVWGKVNPKVEFILEKLREANLTAIEEQFTVPGKKFTWVPPAAEEPKERVFLHDRIVLIPTRILDIPISEMNLERRSFNALHYGEKVMTLRELMEYTESELVNIRNLGNFSLNDIRSRLEDYGVDLGARVLKPGEEAVLSPVDLSTDTPLEMKLKLFRSIETFDWSKRAFESLLIREIYSILDLVQQDESEVWSWRNVGVGTVSEYVYQLDQLGLSFGMKVSKELIEEYRAFRIANYPKAHSTRMKTIPPRPDDKIAMAADGTARFVDRKIFELPLSTLRNARGDPFESKILDMFGVFTIGDLIQFDRRKLMARDDYMEPYDFILRQFGLSMNMTVVDDRVVDLGNPPSKAEYRNRRGYGGPDDRKLALATKPWLTFDDNMDVNDHAREVQAPPPSKAPELKINPSLGMKSIPKKSVSKSSKPEAPVISISPLQKNTVGSDVVPQKMTAQKQSESDLWVVRDQNKETQSKDMGWGEQWAATWRWIGLPAKPGKKEDQNQTGALIVPFKVELKREVKTQGSATKALIEKIHTSTVVKGQAMTDDVVRGLVQQLSTIEQITSQEVIQLAKISRGQQVTPSQAYQVAKGVLHGISLLVEQATHAEDPQVLAKMKELLQLMPEGYVYATTGPTDPRFKGYRLTNGKISIESSQIAKVMAGPGYEATESINELIVAWTKPSSVKLQERVLKAKQAQERSIEKSKEKETRIKTKH